MFRSVLALAFAFAAVPAAAHHGWSAYSDAESAVTGVVESANLGAPHGAIKVRAADGVWNVMLSPPGAIQRSGLTLKAIPKGTRVAARGHKRLDGTLEIKTERLVIGRTTYDLYPARR